ncbi:Hsp20/alpha crystallin family protein [Caldovatus aquaticus]|uniref:Hsp20/alpha crystallin family protein n=1 Tax=Caldovatus aquaticus TaxID=2865671 RepID=A0ABS7F4T0_9PROT|nr:Hsp20/alpha crystallin family protein [Caldovatus aquaticus]MBW8270499.1 Hsp20/alpha crystallin family protein [Caldovatus aquaticus]
MRRDDIEDWMWAEACEALARAERLHRRFFEPRRAGGGARLPVWQPPADVLETEREVLVIVALPGVDPAAVEAVIEDGALRVAGMRLLPPELRSAAIHRLELPQGRFERRIPLPPGRYSARVRHSVADGCLLVRLEKSI